MGVLIVNALFSTLMIPMVMGVVVVMLSFTIAWYSLVWLKSSWFVVVFVLTFIGGMLILFIYVASLAHNEVVAWNLASMTMTLPMGVYVYLLGGVFYCSDITPFDFAESEWYFGGEYCYITIFFMVYLLVVLFVVVEMVGVYGGSVRKVYVFEVL